MKAAFFLALAVALGGCSARYQAGINNPPPPSGVANVQIQSGATGMTTAAALLVIGILAGSAEAAREPRPELAPDRRVNEQDCTKPIADPSANLKCR